MIAEPKSEFKSLDETAVLAALDQGPGNPIAQEVARLIRAYTEAFDSYAEKPDALHDAVPCWPIQTVALRLVNEAAIAQAKKHLNDQKAS